MSPAERILFEKVVFEAGFVAAADGLKAVEAEPAGGGIIGENAAADGELVGFGDVVGEDIQGVGVGAGAGGDIFGTEDVVDVDFFIEDAIAEAADGVFCGGVVDEEDPVAGAGGVGVEPLALLGGGNFFLVEEAMAMGVLPEAEEFEVFGCDRFEGDAGSGGGGENQGWFHAAEPISELE